MSILGVKAGEISWTQTAFESVLRMSVGDVADTFLL